MGRTVALPKSVGMMAKNLQVVSFDADWSEIYLGTVRAGKANYILAQGPLRKDVPVQGKGGLVHRGQSKATFIETTRKISRHFPGFPMFPVISHVFPGFFMLSRALFERTTNVTFDG